jgi:arylsulfatase A-like enzyme
VARIVKQLARERIEPHSRWRRVALQPLVNADFFSRLYLKHRPQFASFHTNHVAHYMHTYWKAMRPEIFPQPTSPEEVRDYAGAIEHGYDTADELLARMLRMIDDDTVLVVASSMGQKPFISPLKRGKSIGQVRSLDRLVEILDATGHVRALSTMSDQFNLYPDTPAMKDVLVQRLRAAYVDAPGQPMFDVDTVEDSITVNLTHSDELNENSRCVFPHREGAEGTFRYEDLVYGTGMVKSGCHDPRGMMIIHGPGVRRGAHIAECDTLDIAPTLLTLLGLPVPAEMAGRVLHEAFAADAPAEVRALEAVA